MPQKPIVRLRKKRRDTRRLAKWRAKQDQAAQTDGSASKPAAAKAAAKPAAAKAASKS